jgi:hypothetical protein
MTRRGVRIVALAGALALAGCGPTPPPSKSSTVEPAVASPSAALDPSPPDASPGESPQPTIDPAMAQGLRLTCGDGLEFPAEALLGEGGAENDFEPASLALRQLLVGPDGDGLDLPPAGWHRAVRTGTNALFLARAKPGNDSNWLVVSFLADPSGWILDSGGECGLTVALPEGIGPASWWLDPSAGPPPAEATSVAAFLVENSCASGKSPAGRVLAPVIRYGDSSVSVLFAIRKRPGGQDCPGNPPLAIQLELTEPIGDRKLLDGGVFPARDASIVPD